MMKKFCGEGIYPRWVAQRPQNHIYRSFSSIGCPFSDCCAWARIGRREQVSIAKLHREMSCVTRIRPHGPYVVGFAGLHDGRL